MTRRLSRQTRQQVAAIQAAGGQVRYTADGHVVFLNRAGGFIGRSRATGHGDGKASREITASMVAKVGPPMPAKPRPAQVVLDLTGPEPVLDLTSAGGGPAEAPASPTPPQEGPMQKVIRVCDACEATGEVVGAVDSLKLESLVTGKRSRLDLCAQHRDALMDTGTLLPLRRGSLEKGHTFPANMRCPVPGDDGYEGPGQGMFQHYRHHHPDLAYDDVQKDAARTAYSAAHANGKARRARVAS